MSTTREHLIQTVYDVMQDLPMTTSDMEDAETIVDAVLAELDVAFVEKRGTAT
jgi:hypothetical protein